MSAPALVSGGSPESLRGTGAPRGPRERVLLAAAAVLLAGPTVIAFWSGGYFDAPRIDAGLIAFALFAVAVVACPRPLPARRGGRLALSGLTALALFTLLSMLWAPVVGSAYHAGQLGLLYAGVLAASAAVLQSARAQRAVEPVLAAGILLVIGYGLSERLLPGLLQFARSTSAQGRLEQPLTYWNAMGELAALGVVLAARLAGDVSRPRAVRIAAAAAGAPLGLGLYLSFSRGALFAAVAGLITLAVVAPRLGQLRAIAVAVISAALAAAVSAPLDGVTSLAGSPAHREGQGLIMLIALLVLMIAAALLGRRLSAGGEDRPWALPRRAPWIAVAVICAGLAVAIVAGAKEHSAQPLGGGGARLVSLQSNRYAYWRVALRAFGQSPLYGVGAGGWAVDWLRWRPFLEGAQDAHSLELQTLAELGVVGLALLAVFLAGVALAARDALRRAPAAA
ncbi:MAG TPA: O-antigen ligase family protein, partial [Solirubrobacteraceae bacterium]|nr:O-antigen ligase family protein [Solirubrobacteraceae bacterium]